jgi:hypothetical protein
MVFLLKCINLKMPCVVKTSCFAEFFMRTKILILSLKTFAEISSLRSMHDDMSAQLCKNCNMIMVNYADLWIVHTQVARQLKGAKLELKELNAHSLLLVLVWNVPSLNLSWTLIPSRLRNLR